MYHVVSPRLARGHDLDVRSIEMIIGDAIFLF